MKGSLCRYLTIGAYIVTTLVALDIGLGAFNSGFLLNSALVVENHQIASYVILASALYMVYLFVEGLQGKKGSCLRLH